MRTDLRGTPLLSAADETELGRRIEAGVYADHLLQTGCPPYATMDELRAVRDDGQAAWLHFYSANLRLAALVANRWAARFRLDADDILQECCLALGGAIRDWDWARGTRFSTLAWPRLTFAAESACWQRRSGGQSPVWWLRAQSRAGQLADSNAARGCRYPARAAAEDMGRPAEWVEKALAWSPPRRLTDDDDAIAATSRDEAPAEMMLKLDKLDDLGRAVVERRFGFKGDPATYTRVAKDLSLSPRTVKRVETRALATLADDLPMAA